MTAKGNRLRSLARISLLVFITMLFALPQLVDSTEFECPLGEAVVAGIGDGVEMRSCFWEKAPGVRVRTGAFELHREDLLILQTQTNQDGKLHGQFSSWDDDGKLINQGEYVEGLKQGEWLETDKLGVSRRLIYIEGEPVSARSSSAAAIEPALPAAPK